MKAKKLNGNTVLLIITIALFFVMYAVGCVIYSNKGFTHLQTFLNILINNAGSALHHLWNDLRDADRRHRYFRWLCWLPWTA